MKLARIFHDGERRCAIVEGEELHLLRGDFLDALQRDGTVVALAEARLLSPVNPPKLVCVGLNYRLHAAESGAAVPEQPMLFLCSPQAIIGSGGQIVLDSQDDRIDFEAELAIVVGRRARDVGRGAAEDHILGYSCANDVSNRPMQKADGQFARAKSFDTYKPIGPWIETDLDPGNVGLRLWQNGELRQSSTTADMIFPPDVIFEFISGIMTLLPGDVIITGTPSGVGPLKAGDQVCVEIDGIGRLTNTVR